GAVAARKQKQGRMSAQVVEDEDYQLRYEVNSGDRRGEGVRGRMRPDAPGGGKEAPDLAPAGGPGDGPGDRGARGGAEGGGGADGGDGGHLGLLARVVRGAGGGRAGGAAGERLPGQEPAGPAEDRQGGRAVDRAADRDGDAAVLVRAAAGDPGAAGVHPAHLRPDRGPHEVLAAAGEAAGGRLVQAVGRRVEA